ncbi:MAG: long-chain fatty acid--CoA ligase [Dehalococcoidia bacterium]|nr:long-chain fatty acid--CoA ligase [Dehalococcoidia bacterium]MSQ35288.1 long-chain fatty acid--CoA ligase [Dehalococcoidia bacterium]
MTERTIQLVDRARKYENRLAMIAPEGSFSYRDLLSASGRAAGALLGGAGDLREARVVFMVPGGWHYAVTQWGIWRAGGVAVPLKLTNPPPQLEYAVADSQASVAVAHPQYEPVLRPIADRLGLRFLVTDALVAVQPEFVEGPTALGRGPSAGSGRAKQGAASVEKGTVSLPALAPGRAAMILYTSGTTSLPKGVLTTHGNIEAQVRSLVQAWEWSQEDRILLFLPMDHIHGIVNMLSCALWSGAVCEAMPAFDADKVWDRVCRGGLTLFMAVPDVYSRLIAAWQKASPDRQRQMSEACGKMRLMVSGSSALPVPRLEAWKEITGHTLLERYGMTEIGMGLSNPLHGERRPGYVGSPLPLVEVRLTDEAGHTVPPGSPGEIQVRGATVFREYWKRPEATEQAFTGGWFRTGDLAVVEAGAHRILGRMSTDIIKSGGEKVSALEIEPVVLRHPAVADCAVLGMPDLKWGEAVTAAVALRSGHALSLAELREFAKQHLAAASVPTRLEIVDALPRNAMGKVVKPELKKIIEARQFPSPAGRGSG